MADKSYQLAMPAEEIDKTLQGAVLFNSAQYLTKVQQAQARENIGVDDLEFEIYAYFDTLEELKAEITDPEPGPLYGVGTEPPFNYYSWDALHQIWKNNGNLKGLDGAPGKDGTGVSATTTPPEEPKTGDLWYNPDGSAVLPVDNVPVEGSSNLVTSGGIYQAIKDAVADALASLLPVGKELWTGSWNSGTITVPDSDKYQVFKITMSGQGTAILALKRSNYLRGIGGSSSEAPSLLTYHFAATFEGDVFTFVACNNIRHSSSEGHGAVSNMTVTGIFGLV